MNQVEISGMLAGIISIIVGVVVIVWPRIIAFVIGAYLIIIGIIAVVAAAR
jgi:uncharacterized membrane protein HdeD (DUF308 family)